MTENTPLQHLMGIERDCRRHAAGLPQKLEIKKRWLGVGFRISDQLILSPLGEIQEILDYPLVTKLPNSKAWFHGIANVRGSLVPVIDLQAFLGLAPVTPGRRSKILRIGMGHVEAGLLAPEIFGMKRFLEDDMHRLSANEYPNMSRFMVSKFTADNDQWGVFSMRVLSEDPEFFQILRF